MPRDESEYDWIINELWADTYNSAPSYKRASNAISSAVKLIEDARITLVPYRKELVSIFDAINALRAIQEHLRMQQREFVRTKLEHEQKVLVEENTRNQKLLGEGNANPGA